MRICWKWIHYKPFVPNVSTSFYFRYAKKKSKKKIDLNNIWIIGCGYNKNNTLEGEEIFGYLCRFQNQIALYKLLNCTDSRTRNT